MFLVSSCAEEEIQQLGTTITATPAELVVADTGDAIIGTIDVKADGVWIATSSNDDWFTYSPSSGEGNAKVTVSLKPNTDDFNEVSGPRTGTISFICGEAITTVTVKQAGEPGLDASRNYVKVTKAEELEAGKSYLIVANTGSSLVAGKPFAETTESNYSYIYGDDVVEQDGVIVRPNANNGYNFVAKGDGYAIQQSNGRYLFQAASYNNFYSTTDLEKADVWTVAFNEDGTAKIENKTVAGKYFQYSIGYTSYGAYGSAQDNAVLPTLYKDSAAPSDETLSVAEETIVKGTATNATIAVKSNKTWKVRCHDEWITSFTKEGTGNGNIEITFDANESYDDVRVAKFQIIGETTNFWITLTQDHLYAIIDCTVAEFKEKEVGDQLYRLTGKIKGIANSTYGNIYLQDGTDYVYVYTLFENADKVAKSFANLGVREGDIVTIVGPRDQYDKSAVEDQKIQMKNAYCEKAVKSQDATVEQLIAAPVASTYLESQYYRVQGLVQSVVSGVYGNFYLKSPDSDKYIYVYGLTAAPVAKNDKSYGSLGIAVGDLVTLVGQRGQYSGASVADQKEQVANAYYITHETPAPALDICEQIFVDAGYKMEDFTRLEIDWTHNGYWNSTDGTNHSKIITKDVSPNATNLTQFAATPQYHRSALPVGTVLVIQGSTSEVANGWMYRPEGWQSKGSKNSGSRPDNVTGKTSPVVAINDAWWGTSFNYRAFNVARVGNPDLTEAQQEELEHVFGIFVPKPYASTDAIMTANEYDLSKYTKLEFTITQKAYYNSNSNSSMVTGQSNCVQFAATNIVEKAQIPNGSVIVVNVGYQYRPEGWAALDGKNATRPGNVGNTVTVVDDAWWGSFNYRAFNLAKFGNPNLTDAEQAGLAAAFAVYVPKN